MPREHNTDEGAQCWCQPHVEHTEDGVIVIHNDAIGAALGLDAKWIAEGHTE